VGPTACLEAFKKIKKDAIKEVEERYDNVKHKQKPMQI
jgi:hypothetical protein